MRNEDSSLEDRWFCVTGGVTRRGARRSAAGHPPPGGSLAAPWGLQQRQHSTVHSQTTQSQLISDSFGSVSLKPNLETEIKRGVEEFGDFVLKTMNSYFKVKDDEFCINNDGFCRVRGPQMLPLLRERDGSGFFKSTNEDSSIENDGSSLEKR